MSRPLILFDGGGKSANLRSIRQSGGPRPVPSAGRICQLSGNARLGVHDPQLAGTAPGRREHYVSAIGGPGRTLVLTSVREELRAVVAEVHRHDLKAPRNPRLKCDRYT